MPRLSASTYRAPFWLPGGHVQTIYPSLCRRVRPLEYVRHRVPTPDGDVICLDLSRASGAGRDAAVLSHGLEGSSASRYIHGMGRMLQARGWDCVARNFRCCGGEMNRLPAMYHSGQTGDLHTTVLWCLERGYRRIALLGFSMGGNQVLKYLGEAPERVPGEVAGAVVFSVPCDLAGCARELARPANRLYMEYFLHSLRRKVRAKHRFYPDLYPLDGLDAIRTFADFDGRYTAPLHGFFSAEDYWERCSCNRFLAGISVPALLVSARNDPFLSAGCYPEQTAAHHPLLFLETPDTGGHVGFTPAGAHGPYWSEQRAVLFLDDWLRRGRP